jgi:hypothetical protein
MKARVSYCYPGPSMQKLENRGLPVDKFLTVFLTKFYLCKFKVICEKLFRCERRPRERCLAKKSRCKNLVKL